MERIINRSGMIILSMIMLLTILLSPLTCTAAFAAASHSGEEDWSDTAGNGRFNVHIEADNTRPFTSFSRYYPVKVKIENPAPGAEDFAGVLKLMLPVSSDTGQTIALGQDILVPAGSSESIAVDIPSFCVNYNGGTNQRYFIMRADILNQKGEQIFSAGFRIRNQLPDMQAYNFAVLTGLITDRAQELDGEYAYDMKDASIELPAGDPYKQAELEGSEKMNAARTGGEETDPAGEGDEEMSAAQTAAAGYGQAMLEGSGYYSALQVLDPKKAETALFSGWSVLILDAPASQQLWSKLLAWVKDGGILLAGEPWLKGISSAQAKDGHGYRLGYGKVIAFESDSSRDIAAYEQLCRSLLQDEDIELMRNLGTETRGSRADAGVYDYDITDTPPDVYKYLAALVIYILVIGPVLYYLLKRRDRLEWLWAAVPVISITASILIFTMGIGQRMTAVSGEAFSTVLMGEDGTVEHTLLKIVNPGKNRTMFSAAPDYKANYYPPYQGFNSLGINQNPDESYAELADEDLPGLMKAGYLLALTDSEGRQDILLGKNRVFSEYGITLDRQLQDTRVLRTDLSCWKGMLYGTVENLTGCDLEDAFILRGPLFYPIGRVKAGEKIQLEGAASYPVYQLQDSATSTAVPFCEDPQAYHLGNAYAVRTCIRQMLNSLHDSVGGANLAGGFTDSYEAGLDQNQFSKLGHLALLCSYTDIRQSGSSWMSSGPLWGTPYSAADEENVSQADHMIYGTEIELLYQLKAGQKMDGLVWLNPDPELHISFYNVKTNRYEEVMGDIEDMEGSDEMESSEGLDGTEGTDGMESTDEMDDTEGMEGVDGIAGKGSMEGVDDMEDTAGMAEMDAAQLTSYISSRRQIRVKVQVDPDVYNAYHMTPAFEIYGGDRDD